MSAYADLFAVRDAAFESAGAVRLANKLTRAGVVSNFVVDLRTRQTAGFRACSNRHCLHSRYRHDRLSQKSVQLQIPGRMRTKSRDNSARGDFEDAAQRVALLARLIDQPDHSLFRFSVGTVQRSSVGNSFD